MNFNALGKPGFPLAQNYYISDFLKISSNHLNYAFSENEFSFAWISLLLPCMFFCAKWLFVLYESSQVLLLFFFRDSLGCYSQGFMTLMFTTPVYVPTEPPMSFCELFGKDTHRQEGTSNVPAVHFENGSASQRQD